jgi:large subunit ribosomal protein L13
MERQKTSLATPETAKREWVLFDAEDQVVGRAATQIATLLRGKDLPMFTPHVDNGHFVVVINAAKVRFTGNKWNDKKYYHHSGYPGGMKEITAEKQLERHPDAILRDAVWGMLPKNRLSRHLMRKLKIYPGVEHPHAAQMPSPLTTGTTP